jgi:hypothetical protein
MKHLIVALYALFIAQPLLAQRPSIKSAKFDFTEVPTIPEDLVRNVQFVLHADPNYFSLDDLRRWGGNAAILKAGERLAGMSHYTLEQEVALVESNPTLMVQVALGEGSMGRRTAKSEAVKGEEMTYWYQVDYEQPLTVQITDAAGNLLDGFELPAAVNVRYGNEKISVIESGKGGFSYSKSKLDYRSETELETAVRTPEAERFIRRKAVLTQLSNMVDVLETRLYFNDVKASVDVASAKNRKVDYAELDAAQEAAVAAFEAQNWEALDGPMATWSAWLERADLLNPKADVNKEVARALHLNLAQGHLYRGDFAACARNLQAARSMTAAMEPEWAQIEAQRTLLANRRKAAASNPGWAPDEVVETFKAIDLKDVLGRRSENKDVDMFSGSDVYAGFTEALRNWKAEAEADAPENQAAAETEQTLEQRLGSRLEQTIGGYMLRLNPLLDRDLMGGAMPEEIIGVDRLAYLDVSGMAFTELPASIARCGTLHTLVLSTNALTALPATIGELGTLKKLLLRGNPLTDLPESLANCSELRVLDLRGTQIPAATALSWQSKLPECKVKYDE